MKHVLSQLEYTNRTLKRAEYEVYEFSLREANILVRNGSHESPEDHEYLVTIEDGVPITCECPADAHYDGACKHRVAVALRASVLEASAQIRTIVDGGRVNEQTAMEEDEDLECDCIEHPGRFPCWECVESGRIEYP